MPTTQPPSRQMGDNAKQFTTHNKSKIRSLENSLHAKLAEIAIVATHRRLPLTFLNWQNGSDWYPLRAWPMITTLATTKLRGFSVLEGTSVTTYQPFDYASRDSCSYLVWLSWLSLFCKLTLVMDQWGSYTPFWTVRFQNMLDSTW